MRARTILTAKLVLCMLTLPVWSQAGEEQGAGYTPRVEGRLDDLAVPAEPILRQLPGVAEVEVRRSDRPARHRIVHLRDWHFLPKDLFAADIRDQGDRPVRQAEVDRLYSAFLSEVEAVQAEQRALLRCLVEHHGLSTVFQEGLTQGDMPVYRAKLRVLRKLEGEMSGLRGDQAEIVRTLSEMKGAGQGSTADYRELAEIQHQSRTCSRPTVWTCFVSARSANST